MLSPSTRIRLLQVLPFGIITLFFTAAYALIENGILGNHPIYPATGNPYEPDLLITVSFGTLSGLIIGLLEIFYIKKWFSRDRFIKKVIYKASIYLLIIVVTILINVVIRNALELDAGLFDSQVWRNALTLLFSLAFLSLVFFIGIVVCTCLFYVEVSDIIGQGLLFNIFAGKYHQPIEEERIFMFLDMKSSTTIAEQLGHTEYFKILKEYYADVSDPIIKYAGQIYQYVGDEIVITWNLQKGLANNNCIRCFYAMKAALHRQAEKYDSTFGIVPSFKAGLHYGMVTTGEIGVIKKEILFTGDVLNTAARIQSLCNQYEVDLLLSAQLANSLKPDTTLQTKNLGETALRGRHEKMELFTVSDLS